MESESVHKPVLLREIIEHLNPKPGDQFIDATLNGGGHAMAMAEKVFPDGRVMGIEWDPELFKEFELKAQGSKFKDNFILVNDSYVNIENIAREYNFRPKGILFDLGLSSWHYEKSGRGFSFRRDEALDMRYNPSASSTSSPQANSGQAHSTGSGQATAAEIVNTYSKEEIERILREYGEEQFAENIAGNIVHTRREGPILKTSDLVEVISRSVPGWYKKRKIHFATRTFQALRIAVNDELKNVSDGVSSAINILVPGGRLAVVSFHGTEDKIVREIFKKGVKEGIVKFVVKGTVKPSWDEVKSNSRARSAKMKIIEKV